MRIWNSLFIILFYLVLVKSLLIGICCFAPLFIPHISCFFNLFFALYPTVVDASLSPPTPP